MSDNAPQPPIDPLRLEYQPPSGTRRQFEAVDTKSRIYAAGLVGSASGFMFVCGSIGFLFSRLSRTTLSYAVSLIFFVCASILYAWWSQRKGFVPGCLIGAAIALLCPIVAIVIICGR